MRNIYLLWLRVLAIVLVSFAAVVWLITVSREQSEFGSGASGIAFAGWLLQTGVLAAFFWLLGRAIVDHLERSGLTPTDGLLSSESQRES